MEFNNNMIKLFKNTKNGCFEKSLGATKYKLNEITYDPELLVTECVHNILDNLSNGIDSSIILFGPKSKSITM